MLATACGYTYPQIDEMTLLQYYELCEYWADNPPAHILLKMVHKYQRTKPEAQDLSKLFSEMTGKSLPV